jgi:hypothetical protein
MSVFHVKYGIQGIPFPDLATFDFLRPRLTFRVIGYEHSTSIRAHNEQEGRFISPKANTSDVSNAKIAGYLWS